LYNRQTKAIYTLAFGFFSLYEILISEYAFRL
jgi:hypothetical protein